MRHKIIIDATDSVLGRIASFAAKNSLLGREVIIVNCNDAIVIGSKQVIMDKYSTMRKKGGSSLTGPHFPKNPEKLIKRTIRGMLSHKQMRGKEALKRIICYNKVPEEYKSVDKINFNKSVKFKSMTLSKIEELL